VSAAVTTINIGAALLATAVQAFVIFFHCSTRFQETYLFRYLHGYSVKGETIPGSGLDNASEETFFQYLNFVGKSLIFRGAKSLSSCDLAEDLIRPGKLLAAGSSTQPKLY
jgi:hypothetical protein